MQAQCLSLDGRTRSARLVRSMAQAFTADLGGAAHMTASKRQMVQRLSAASVMARQWEDSYAAGGHFDRLAYTALLSEIRQTYDLLGLCRGQPNNERA